ncbi:hypothetical protein BAY59_31335 [Prauserella coralliicola]|uniref:Uncharacterized protein n=2 Tax=Prauserella endophytica TaxID=1592324 RepID=A0ABY2S022_9PSEU|nr:hypothetical protein BAY59_31335 [Prauserella coralliicola]TKG66936.1 hypothetical protein FCN18_23785 [Prauserella endophytica]
MTSELRDELFARAEPDRFVLADIESKRRIIEEYEGEVSRGPAGDREDFVARHEGILDAYRTALRALALPYDDHPDYREEWRP